MADYYPAPGKNHLFIPGPTNIPERIMQAMNRNNEDHRSAAFPVFSKRLIDDTRGLFKSKSGTCFIIPTTGSGGWECALTNTLSPRDKVLTFRFGQFSSAWVQRMNKLNYDADVVDTEWGCGVDLEKLRSKLQADRSHSIKALCIVHNETSTGVTNDLAAIRKVLDEVGHPALYLVDAVSSIGGLDFRMDEWRIDVALTGSQKALSMPTGLGIICASPRAIEVARTTTSPRSFFDWNEYLKCYKIGNMWPYTPSVQMLYGLRAAIDLIFEEGLDNVIARHHRYGEATRLAVKAWGLKLFTRSPEWNSDTVTTVLVPPHIHSGVVVKLAWKKYNLSLGVGLGEVVGKVFRIGHLGNMNELQLLGALAGTEMVLNEVGISVPVGSGVVAASNYLSKSTPLIRSRI